MEMRLNALEEDFHEHRDRIREIGIDVQAIKNGNAQIRAGVIAIAGLLLLLKFGFWEMLKAFL